MNDSMNRDNLSAGDWFFGQVLKMGANWKTTLGGLLNQLFDLLVILSIAPYTLPDNITSIIPAKVKGLMLSIAGTCKIVTGVWTWYNTKSKNVTGGSVQQTPDNDLAKPGTQSLVDATKKATIANE
jgi:hypothetical protein